MQIKIAERISAKMNENDMGGSSGSGDGVSQETKELRSMLLSMGIGSLVTKELAGNSYLTQLSRQLSDMLVPYLQSMDEMIVNQVIGDYSIDFVTGFVYLMV
eukprot:TRINITY_DN22599_c0_g1_i1.p1 TRINITY_DN22599_c0_g1~~TRINITY_DN22599_c0_g1_i1.p1  ORF type:complete len:102 (-),score=17.57 TRINITY_DN22599_c0_g1_i1:25-330(-)